MPYALLSKIVVSDDISNKTATLLKTGSTTQGNVGDGAQKLSNQQQQSISGVEISMGVRKSPAFSTVCRIAHLLMRRQEFYRRPTAQTQILMRWN